MIGGSGEMVGKSPVGAIRLYGGTETATIKGKVLLRLLTYLRPYRGRVALALVFMLMATAASLAIPVVILEIIDVRIAAGIPSLIRGGVLLGAAMIVSYIAKAAQTLILSRTGQSVLFNLKNSLFEHLQRLSVAYNDTHIVGVTVSRVINDVSVINTLLSEGLVAVVGDTLLIAGTVVAMLLIAPKLALFTFTIIPVMILAAWLFTGKARVAFRDTREKIATLVGNLAENIAGMRVIQAYVQERERQRGFAHNNLKNRDANIRAITLSFVFLPAIDMLAIVASSIVLFAGGMMSRDGAVTVGVIVAFMTYVNRFFIPIQELSQLFSTLQSATAGGERVLEILDTRPAVVDAQRAVDVSRVKGRVEFDHVSFSYVPGVEVLHDVSFSIEPGQTAAIVGPTGAGKSTIVNIVCRFYEVDSGVVRIDSHDVREITVSSLHARMGYVSQDPFLFAGSIAENIGFGDDKANESQMIEAARQSEAHTFIEKLPAGYATRVLEGGANFSTGQRQLLSIARALLVRPPMLIMDEATSSVDTVTEGSIQRALDRLLRDRTAIVIAHRLTTVQNADIIFVLDDGRMVERGSHQDLIRAHGVYANLYEKQFIDA